MTSRLLALTFVVAAVFGSATPGWAQSKVRSWLDDAKPQAWNKPAAAIPAAPRMQPSVDPRCRAAARPAQLPEDTRLRERGWDLVGAFQGGWQLLVIRGTAGYDGMCRPRQYQDFVFARGAFAGTLSPQPMDSRIDGALDRVVLQGPAQLTAEYARYDAKDPLCCPSRTTRVVFTITKDGVVQPAPSPSTGLAGTSWQLVRFEGSDDRTLTPDDRSKYTIEFAAGGRLSARIDCNRGSGTWTSAGPSQVEFGPMALTRAQCLNPSLHDHIVRQWANIRSYVLKDGHLFLALKADGGIFEFEPITPRK